MDSEREKAASCDDTAQAYLDMRMTAEIYLDLGPEEYRNMIDQDLQLEAIPRDVKDNIEHGMRQILEGRGLTRNRPFVGLDIVGFYKLAEMLNLVTESQALAEFRGTTEILDAMHMVDSVTGEQIVLYNLVPTPSARSAAEAAGGRKIRIGQEWPRLYNERQ